jgi:SAM-dependent methyltransferase
VIEDRRRAESFGAAADRYDRSRPGYPAALVDAIVGPDPASLRVVDVGCGTGIAARALAARGARVVGVEADARMASVARRRGIEVEVARFEQWDPAGRTFDRVTAGQSWHWVEPAGGATRAAEALAVGGRLCLFWNLGQPDPAVAADLEAVYRRLAPELDRDAVVLGRHPDLADRHYKRLAAIEAKAELGPLSRSEFPWSRRYTTAEWLDQLPTHSDHAVMLETERDRLLAAVGEVIDNAGGSFVMHYRAVLFQAERV